MEFSELLKKFSECTEKDMTVKEIEKELNFNGKHSHHHQVNKLAFLLGKGVRI